MSDNMSEEAVLQHYKDLADSIAKHGAEASYRYSKLWQEMLVPITKELFIFHEFERLIRGGNVTQESLQETLQRLETLRAETLEERRKAREATAPAPQTNS